MDMSDNIPSKTVEAKEDCVKKAEESSAGDGVKKIEQTTDVNTQTDRYTLPSFDPDDLKRNVDSWLQKIEELAITNNFTEREKMYVFQNNLEGAARLWFDKLCVNVNLSWEQWKTALRNTFHKPHNFAQVMENIVNRKKKPEESIINYYKEVLVLCASIGITGVHAVSCLIHGLPKELQKEALTFRSENPGDLLATYLLRLEDFSTNVKKETVQAVPDKEVKHEPIVVATKKVDKATLPAEKVVTKLKNSEDKRIRPYPNSSVLEARMYRNWCPSSSQFGYRNTRRDSRHFNRQILTYTNVYY